MFRKLRSSFALFSVGLSCQLLTIVLTGLATGYFFSIYHWQFVLLEDYTMVALMGAIGFVFGSGATSLIIFGTTLNHLYRLSLGGEALAESLGGVAFEAGSAPGSLARLPRINEQVAAMFGVPAPKLYWLPQEEGINAFAAGKDPQSAVIGVTRGMRRLGDKQLRGMLAHEMAHICNGDMQHNMRLLAIVLGLKSIQRTASQLIHWGMHLFSKPSGIRFALFQLKWGVICMLLGLVCFPMGVVGALVGSLLLAATNRRRELRADRIAAAVLNDPTAVSDALKMILGDQWGARLSRPQSRAWGHVMFAQANGSSGGLLGSHPTLQARIRIQDPQWDGLPLYEAASGDSASEDRAGPASDDEACAAGPSPYTTAGELGPLQNVSADLIALFRDPTAGGVTLPALLLFEASDRPLAEHVRGGQLNNPIASLWAVLEGLQADERIALLDVCRHTVRQLDRSAAAEVLALVDDVADAAGEAAWNLQAWRALLHSSTRRPAKMPRAKIGKLEDIFRDLIELLSIMSVAAENGGLAEFRFHRGWGRLGLPLAGVLPADVLAWPDLEAALRKAVRTPAPLRQQIADACLAALTADGRLDVTQAAMARLVCERLGQPARRLLPGRVS